MNADVQPGASAGPGPGFEAALEAALEAAGLDSPLVVVGADGAGAPVVDVPAAGWVAAARFARDELGLDFFDWLSAVDEPEADPAGLDVVLHLACSTRPSSRLLLRARVADTALVLASLTGLWPGAAWHERETFEMFGLVFDDFTDPSGSGLRPLLLPDGFEGTPLRKSFVLAARAAKAWPGAKDPGDPPGAGGPGGRAPARRKNLPPGVPAASWGPREPGAAPPEVPAERPRSTRPARAARAGVSGTAVSGDPATGAAAAASTEPDGSDPAGSS